MEVERPADVPQLGDLVRRAAADGRAVYPVGVITQVTLKVKPRPQEQALVAFGCDEARLADMLDRLHASRTRPVCVDVLDRVAASAGPGLPEAPWVVVVGFEDSRDAVTWQ